jgi:hypothetical protein
MDAVNPATEPVDGADEAAVESRRETAGLLLVLVAHLLTMVPYGVFAFVGSPRQLVLSMWCFLAGQVIVLAGCLGRGIQLLRRSDRGLGRGLLIGWPLGLFAVLLTFAAIVFLAVLAHP